ncbi:hypothetical protein AYI69_g5101 [Smittium culicis]|uniref:Uncharacterized protein n=1 Tax=Smittium culicis TaxID=133412 RepID=A0A1R1Y8A2_9FUNG|nr:hypothetical protein AYI69_g5101 [Smittium culicis]
MLSSKESEISSTHIGSNSSTPKNLDISHFQDPESSLPDAPNSLQLQDIDSFEPRFILGRKNIKLYIIM